ncbi:MAG: hypothetical protein SVX43_11255 [Cyanobacteriota bacterium]|nr:hypothetical protein [Cyanobacteriota bacterium]
MLAASSNQLTDNLGKIGIIAIAPDERAGKAMKLPRFLSNLPTPLRIVLIHPWFYLAVALHAVVLMLPTEWQWNIKTAQPPEDEDVIKITQLPSSKEKDSPTPPSPARSPQQTLPSTPRQDSSAQFAADRTSNLPFKSPSQQRERAKPVSQSQENSTPPNPTPPDDFFEDFPKYPNAQQGSGGVLRPEFESGYVFHAGDSLETVVATFESELLPPSPFRWEIRTNKTDFRVYEIFRSSDDESKFLHLIFEDNKTVLYLESAPYSLEQLKNAKTKPMDIVQMSYVVALLDIKKDTNERIKEVQNHNSFEGRGFDFYVFKNGSSLPENMASSIDTKLKEQDLKYKFSKINEYEGGILYKLTKENEHPKENEHIYLIFVPTPDQQTLVIFSQNDPRD